MGNHMETFRDNVQWHISLDHLEHKKNCCIFAGNTLKGQVHVKSDLSIPPVKLILEFKGKEKTRISMKRGVVGDHKSDGAREICTTHVTLQEKGDTRISPGTYVFPFEINLPNSLPSTKEGSEKGMEWRIRYRLSVNVALQDDLVIKKIASRYFAIASVPLKDESIPALISPVSLDIDSHGGMIDRGSLAIAARVLDVHVGRGTDLKIYVGTRNMANASIYRVQVEIIEKIVCLAATFQREDSISIIKLDDVELPGILRRPNINGNEKELLDHLYRELFDESNMFNMVVPYECRDTYKGGLVHIAHTLKITMFTKALVSNPSIEIPLRIGFPPEKRVDNPEQHHDNNASSPRKRISIQNLPDMITPYTKMALITIDENAVLAPTSLALRESIKLGGSPIHYDEDGSLLSQPTPSVLSSAPHGDLLVLPPSTTEEKDISLKTLFEEMTISINDYDILTQKLDNDHWKTLLCHITVDEFEGILGHVNLTVDQPRVASLLARNIGSRFTCEYAKAVTRVTDWNRTTTVAAVLPYCLDIGRNHNTIEEALTDWELRVIKIDLEQAIHGAFC